MVIRTFLEECRCKDNENRVSIPFASSVSSASTSFITGGVRAYLHGDAVGGVDVVPHLHLGLPLEEASLRAEPIPAALLQILRPPGVRSFILFCCILVALVAVLMLMLRFMCGTCVVLPCVRRCA